MRANYSGVREVYAKKVQPQGEAGWIYDPFVGVERVRTELFAFQVDSPSAYKAISRTFTEAEKCSLSELQMIILPRTTILVERNSGYKELIRQRYNDLNCLSLSCFLFFSRLGISQFYFCTRFFLLKNDRIKWFKETGLMKHDESKWIPKKPDCEGGRRGFMTVGLNEIKPAIILLVIGYGVAVLFLGAEVIQNFLLRKKLQKKPKIRFVSQKIY